MSTATDLAQQEDTGIVSKKERRGRKEKKEKKRSKPQSEPTDIASKATHTPAKKRKRDALPDEIEINVDLPEPASKKAARKAKKVKLNPTHKAENGATTADTKQQADAGEDKDKPGKRSEFGVWIGNLPWSATKDSLRKFLVDNADMQSEQITRVHLPPPTKPVNPNWTNKPLNKGFAYVDFSTELAMYSAIALTETKMDGRALLIKNAKSFEGRPDKPKQEEAQNGGQGSQGTGKQGNPPNKRVFVGNLSFDVTKEDLETHYGQCGAVEHIHMATFEDSGKCKGFAWITFGDVEAATSAVNGYVYKDASEFRSKKNKDENDSEDDVKKTGKQRKWLVNKLFGRELRCEFAEDSTTRYNKRYGKDKAHEPVEGVNPGRWKNFEQSDEQGGRKPRKKVDPRTIKSGAAHANAPRASHAIVESQGKKITFD